jgi:osmotically-inducible protein OsmY
MPLVAHDVRMTRNRMNWIRATFAAVLATGMMACATTRATPHAAAPDDQTLKTRVQTSLMNAAGVHANEVTAEVTQAVATLSGTVHSQSEADAAVAAARRVDGVKDVRSNLRVQ